VYNKTVIIVEGYCCIMFKYNENNEAPLAICCTVQVCHTNDDYDTGVLTCFLQRNRRTFHRA